MLVLLHDIIYKLRKCHCFIYLFIYENGPKAQSLCVVVFLVHFASEKNSGALAISENGEENGGQNPNQVGSFADESVSDEADDESCAEQSPIDPADSSAGTRNPAVFFPVVVESTELAHFAP